MGQLTFRCENMLHKATWPYFERCAGQDAQPFTVPGEGEHLLCATCQAQLRPAEKLPPSECQWFALCVAPAHRQVHHPILGWLYCCENHIAWMGESVGPIR